MPVPGLSAYLDDEFAEASLGYLSCPVEELPFYEEHLRRLLENRQISLTRPKYTLDGRLHSVERHVHYRGIYHAVLWGINNPAAWELGRQPLRLAKRYRFEGFSS